MVCEYFISLVHLCTFKKKKKKKKNNQVYCGILIINKNKLKQFYIGIV